MLHQSDYFNWAFLGGEGGGLTLFIKCPITLGDCWYFFSDDFFLGPRLDKIFKDAFATILDNNLILCLVSENVFTFHIKPGSHHLLVLWSTQNIINAFTSGKD